MQQLPRAIKAYSTYLGHILSTQYKQCTESRAQKEQAPRRIKLEPHRRPRAQFFHFFNRKSAVVRERVQEAFPCCCPPDRQLTIRVHNARPGERRDADRRGNSRTEYSSAGVTISNVVQYSWSKRISFPPVNTVQIVCGVKCKTFKSTEECNVASTGSRPLCCYVQQLRRMAK